MNDTMSLAEREQQIYAKITKKLGDTGEKERLKEWLLVMLEECGWKEQLKKDCLSYAREHSSAAASSSAASSSVSSGKKGEVEAAPTFKDITLESLLGSLQTKAKDAIPLHIKVELLNRLRIFFQNKESVINCSQ